MYFQSEQLYHIYNRGNNKQQIFFTRENYLYFLRKVRKELLNYCEILSWCLMPNHFHFLVFIKNNNICQTAKTPRHPLIQGIATLLSSYSQAINKQENRSGSIFQKKTKEKCLEISSDGDYPFICFNYIHQNPMKSGLVKKMEDWEFSSFRDYIGIRKKTLCNQKLAKELIDLPSDKKQFYEMSYKIIDDDVNKIF
ncbi:MAG: transposase [Bacteroidetes bacterium]|nr:transposase [Bacteroidota bacterium]